jgi:hypothetical protein
VPQGRPDQDASQRQRPRIRRPLSLQFRRHHLQVSGSDQGVDRMGERGHGVFAGFGPLSWGGVAEAPGRHLRTGQPDEDPRARPGSSHLQIGGSSIT